MGREEGGRRAAPLWFSVAGLGIIIISGGFLSDVPSHRSKGSLSIFPPHRGGTEPLCSWHLGPAIILPLIYFTEFSVRCAGASGVEV